MKRKFLISQTAIGAALGILSSQPSLAEGMPEYAVEKCCEICPKAFEDATYTGDMGDFSKLVMGKDDWLFRTKTDLMTQMGTTPEGYAHLKRLNEALKSLGTQLMIVYLPTRGMANADKLSPEVRQTYDLDLAERNYQTVITKMRSLGIVVPDLTPLLKTHAEEGKPFFFKRDHHWTPSGAQFAARIVAEELRNASAFKNVTRKEFVSRPDGQNNKIGSLNQALHKICGYSYENQYVSRFITEPKNEANDLFGDASVPEVVMAGTSFSTPQYNFVGFLKEQASIDIDNRSIAGGGFHSAMLEYLGSKDFQERPPKILIWEITSYYDLSMPIFYRQIMPMLADGCRDKSSTLSRKVTLQPGKNEILVNTGVLPILSERYMADVQFSQTGIKNFNGTVWYMSGSREQLKIERTREVEGDGRFVFYLRDDAEGAGQTLLSFDVELPPDAPKGLQADVNICARKPGQMQAQAD